MKWLHLITFFLFGYFVVVQYNDPDFLKWLLIYSPMAIIALLVFLGRAYANVMLLYTIILLALLISYIPDFAQWRNDGMPSITDLDTANVERMREFFGMAIAFVFSISYWLYWRKRKSNF